MNVREIFLRQGENFLLSVAFSDSPALFVPVGYAGISKGKKESDPSISHKSRLFLWALVAVLEKIYEEIYVLEIYEEKQLRTTTLLGPRSTRMLRSYDPAPVLTLGRDYFRRPGLSLPFRGRLLPLATLVSTQYSPVPPLTKI